MASQNGRRMVVTGTGGLGYETALALVGKGASIILAGRNAAKGERAVAQIRAAHPQAQIRFEELDLASLDSIAQFAERLTSEGEPIDVLINNAGVAAIKHRKVTQDGFEMQIGTNHLGHFALTMRLMPLLMQAQQPRIVSLSSTTHKMGRIAIDDLQSERSYNPQAAYAQSKLATLMFALELDERAKLSGSKLISVAAHPGIAQTDLMSNGPSGRPIMQFFAHAVERLFGQSAAEGALPTLQAATDPDLKGGAYLGPSGLLEMKGSPDQASISPRALDGEMRRKLWEVSERLTGTAY